MMRNYVEILIAYLSMNLNTDKTSFCSSEILGFLDPTGKIYASKTGEKLKIKVRLNRYRENSKLVPTRKRPKVDASIFLLFFDASERREWISAESKILASTFGRCRLYRLKPCTNCFIFLLDSNLDHIKVNFTREDFRRRSEKFCTKSNSVYRMLRQVENDLPKNSLVAT